MRRDDSVRRLQFNWRYAGGCGTEMVCWTALRRLSSLACCNCKLLLLLPLMSTII